MVNKSKRAKSFVIFFVFHERSQVKKLYVLVVVI